MPREKFIWDFYILELESNLTSNCLTVNLKNFFHDMRGKKSAIITHLVVCKQVS